MDGGQLPLYSVSNGLVCLRSWTAMVWIRAAFASSLRRTCWQLALSWGSGGLLCGASLGAGAHYVGLHLLVVGVLHGSLECAWFAYTRSAGGRCVCPGWGVRTSARTGLHVLRMNT